MARYKITICYDGGRYYGFQKQDGLPTVQGEIEKVLSTRFSENIVLRASGRTDAGVHAIAQVAHFDTSKNFETSTFGYSINTMLPRDIAVTSCERVNDDFMRSTMQSVRRISTKSVVRRYILRLRDFIIIFVFTISTYQKCGRLADTL